jgi:UDP-N-acetylmuramate dehydrogenase
MQANVDLSPYNTFRVAAVAKRYLELNAIEDLPLEPALYLGSGANILFVKPKIDFVVKNNLKGKKIIKESDVEVILEIASGENWHEFVMWTVNNGWSGIENLADIPGTVGAAPVQNLAAYGQNVGENIQTITGFNLETRTIETLSYQQCKLFYRDSIFKHELRDKFFITSVTFRLYKSDHFATDYYSRYESLKSYLPQNPTPKTVAEAVTKIRIDKLPDWRTIGTAGSVFKNPFVTKKRYDELAKEVKQLQMYPINKMLYPNPDDPVFKMTDMVKIPAGRLLDELGWLGKRIGNVSTHPKHALIVINLGGATGQEIFDYILQMQSSVKKAYGIDLEPEINIVK